MCPKHIMFCTCTNKYKWKNVLLKTELITDFQQVNKGYANRDGLLTRFQFPACKL